ncbi:MBL fold metallo-hydrolase [Conyzicola sp.]|uniref:MBL fold metallo-hydrolase n=1 Tax=Conyzicola sp. TaxID=1969404 RepID=UPI0039899A75
MHLTPLGCLAGMPLNGQASSGYLVDSPDQMIMLDAGPGTALALSRHLADRRLDAVFVSHQHTDHLYDLLPIGKMLLALRLTRDPRTLALAVDESVARVPLFLPVGALAALRILAALFPVTTHPLLDRAFDLAFDVHEYEPSETVQVGDTSLRFELLEHVSPNCGVRIERDDASLVYTGDTGVTDALPLLATGAGTLLAESTLRESDVSGHGHLSSADAGRAAADAGVAELILTHFSSTQNADLEWHRAAASAQFSGPVRIARPEQTFTVQSPTAPLRKATA